MSLDFISGLLLLAVIVAVVVLFAKVFFGDRIGDLGKVRRQVGEGIAKHAASEAKPVNTHLIGATGQVVGLSDDASRPMRIRLGPERWPARLQSGDSPPSVGATVEVTGFDGPVAIVIASRAAEDESQYVEDESH